MCGAFSGFCSLPSPPFAFHCVSVWRVPVLSRAWGLMAGFSGFESLQNLKFWKVFFTVEFYKFWNGNIFFNKGIFFLYSVDKNSDFDCPITIIIIKIIWSSKSEGETEDWYNNNYSTLIVLVAFLQWFFLFALIFPVLILNTSWFL